MKGLKSVVKAVSKKTTNIINNCQRAIMSAKAQVASLTVAASIISTNAMAWTAPAANAPGFDFYDLFVNKGIEGPLGFVGGIALIGIAGMMIKDNAWKAAGTALGGAGLIKAEALTTSFGALIA